MSVSHSKLMVTAAGKPVGHVWKDKTAWHFEPSATVSLVAPSKPQRSLTDLAAEIEQALATKGIEFREMPAIKRKPKRKRSKPLRKLKLTREEWLERERLERKYMLHEPLRQKPAAVSLAVRPLGWPARLREAAIGVLDPAC